MDHRELASRFAAFCGPDRFKKFVLQLNRECRGKGRLLFWQAELWAGFASTQQGEVPLTFEGIAEALRFCPVHELPLMAEDVAILYGLVRFPPEYPKARDERFPFANAVAYGGCCVGPQKRASVYFCEGCRRERRQWRGDEER